MNEPAARKSSDHIDVVGAIDEDALNAPKYLLATEGHV